MSTKERISELLEEMEGLLRELGQACRELARQAVTDELTGLFNRRYLTQRLREELSRAERFGHPLSLIFVDIDDFKRVNDGSGHDAGDRLLQEFARVLEEHRRTMDVAFRVGGEEFIVLLPETDRPSAIRCAERLCATVAGHTFLDGGAHVTISIGVATYPQDAGEGEALVRAADQAHYHAKGLGKNRVAGYPEVRPARAQAASLPGQAEAAASAEPRPGDPPRAAPSAGAGQPPRARVVMGFRAESGEPTSFWIGREVYPILQVAEQTGEQGAERLRVQVPGGEAVLVREGSAWFLEGAVPNPRGGPARP